MSMSASILRNLVSSIFGVNPAKVILSGELPKNFFVQSNKSSGNLYDTNDEANLYAFNSTRGFILIEGHNVNSQNANGSWNQEIGFSFEDCAIHEDALFFISKEKKCGSSNGETWDYIKYTLYKAPNFKEFFDKINQEDLARWEQWLA